MGVVSTSSSAYIPEKWVLILREPEGEIFTLDVAPEIYYKYQLGDTLQLDIKYGRISGDAFDIQIVE